MSHRPDAELIAGTRNTARFFTETRHVAWVLLVSTMLWGVWGYVKMPHRKDPDIPIRTTLAICFWPGAGAERIEDRVTRRMEEAIAGNATIEKMESISRTSVAAVYITIDESVTDRVKAFDDLKARLEGIRDLPEGAGPVIYLKDFGDTATLMLTVASPQVAGTDLRLRAASLRTAIESVRGPSRGGSPRVTVAHGLPPAVPSGDVARLHAAFVRQATADGLLADVRPIVAPGFLAADGVSQADDGHLLRYARAFSERQVKSDEIHPDAWPPFVVRDPSTTETQLARVAGDKYSYRELDDFTDLVARTLKALPIVAKVDRTGVLDEQIVLDYSQERLASYGVSLSTLARLLGARNISAPGGVIGVEGRNLTINPTGELGSEREIGDILVPTTAGGSVYLRDLASVNRSYTSPPRFLNVYGRRDSDGEWRRTRAVTLSIQMKKGSQIAEFAETVDRALGDLRARLPEDLVLARTSDQPQQVEENVGLFMRSLEEAVVLVVIVSLIGFWEWRSALLIAASIPLTLAMTFGMMLACGVDLQQVSIASLIIALGLLVDDPVVAGDAIRRELAAGHPRGIAAWLGPTKLANAILFATVTNIVAYLPYLLLPGDTGVFLHTLPIVITCSLVASRLVSMTFIPLLGYYLLRPGAEPSTVERRRSRFVSGYYAFGRWAIDHRWASLAFALLVLVAGGVLAGRLKTQFFPQDHQYLSYVNVWLPADAPLAATRSTVDQVEGIIRRIAGELSAGDAKQGGPALTLESLTSFIGGGGPRFWFSVPPEALQLNYAQVLIQIRDKHDTARLVDPLQQALAREVPGALVDVRRLETGPPIGVPVAVRLSGDDIPTLRRHAREARDILDAAPLAVRVRDDWGAESFAVELRTDADRANLSGVTNLDVAASSATAMNGAPIGVLRDGDRRIPILARLRADERAQFADMQNLYVHAIDGPRSVPLASVSTLAYDMRIEQLRRRNQFRTITVSAFPAIGHLPSEVLASVRPAFDRLAASLPPGYRMEIGGEYEEQNRGIFDQAMVGALSVGMIFLALVVQFRHAVKPFIVFAAIPFGVVGAFAALWIMNESLGFMAFLGVISLVGVIVSHIIVLFDFIEEARERGEPLVEALLDAGLVRLRPVLITSAATVIALVPLAVNGGPLWKPMCYTQIGGLVFATGVTLLLVPVIYATAVLDLKLVKWAPTKH